jgi:signal transduction histidine kinase
MSDIAFISRKCWPELLWAVFVLGNLAVIVVVPAYSTIPFHNVWVSLTLLYGFRLWTMGATVPMLVAVCLGTGAAMAITVADGRLPIDELAEVPMMACMFLTVVWHAHRHHTALRRLERSRERERDFVRHASHQLRTPITVARGHLELVRATSDDASVVEDTGIAVSELDHLSRIQDRLLLLATADHVGFIAHDRVDLRALAERVARRWRPAARRQWRLSVEVDGCVDGDAERLETALDALVENAVKATSTGDVVEIRVRPAGDAVAIEVADTGVGIPADVVQRVFDGFWTQWKSHAQARGSTGLGLATVKAIAEAHGGRAVAAARPGGGTTVRIELPWTASRDRRGAVAGTRMALRGGEVSA